MCDRVVHGIHIGTDTYWKKSLKNFISLDDFYYNKRIESADYPWGSLTRANYTLCTDSLPCITYSTRREQRSSVP